ncbi:MAG: oligosaccharide flippase family protein [Bryobacteraceae bacterium]
MSSRFFSTTGCGEVGSPSRVRVEAASLEAGVSWALLGNVIFAASQWGIIVALAKLGGTVSVGQFSLGLAIATPILTFTNLQLRAIQATDAEGKHSFAEYFQLRRTTTTLALVAIAVVLLSTSYRGATVWVVLCVAIAKAIDSFSDVHYGLFQKQERFRTIATSLVLRGGAGTLSLAVVLYLTGNCALAVMTLAAAWLGVLLLHDSRWRGIDETRTVSPCAFWSFQPSQFAFLRSALPLGFASALMSLQASVPRYFVQWRDGEATLGIFSAIAYLGTLLTVFIDALGAAAMPRLSRYFANGQFALYRRLTAKLVAAGALAGIGGVAAAALLGDLVLRVAYGAEYVPHRGLFVWLMTATGAACIGTLLNCALTAAGRLRIQVPTFLAALAVTASCCTILIPRAGMQGAAWSMLMAAAIHASLTAAIVLRASDPSPEFARQSQ